MAINTREKRKALREMGQCVAFYVSLSRESLTDAVIFEQRHEGNEEAGIAGMGAGRVCGQREQPVRNLQTGARV